MRDQKKRCRLTCPHGDRCRREADHEGGCSYRQCDCNEPSAPAPLCSGFRRAAANRGVPPKYERCVCGRLACDHDDDECVCVDMRDPDGDGDDLDDDEGCTLGERCLCPHPDHMSDECFSLEMAEDYHRRASADEHPDGGDCEVCGDLTHMATMVYQLPVHGAYASPAPSRLCEACAYELAERLSDWAESERAHARKCGATIPGDPSGE